MAKGIKLQDKISAAIFIPPRVRQSFLEAGIETIEDLVYYLPIRYEDWRRAVPPAAVRPGETACVEATIVHIEKRRTPRRQATLVRFELEGGGARMAVVFFHQPYLLKQFAVGDRVIVYGEVEFDREVWRMAAMTHPTMLKKDTAQRRGLPGRIVPIYRRIGSITSYRIEKTIREALERLEPGSDPIPESIRAKHGFPDRLTALRIVHQVDDGGLNNPAAIEHHPAYRRLVYEDLFMLQVGLAFRRALLETHVPGIAFRIPDDLQERMRTIFPFELTAAQKRALGEILADMERPHPMHRLLQGDVGSGKTAVAILAMVVAVANGYQAAFMAPTELLAEQHYATLRHHLEPHGYRLALLTGSVRGRARRPILERLAVGDLDIVVGTHALFQKGVEYHRLGFVVIDEQHRFGVHHRARLRAKGARPDTLVMTATPIPRSLALTLYGDLDVSILDEMPPGRKPVVTRMVTIAQRASVYRWLTGQLERGHQAYIVCPLIEESEKLQVQAAVKLYDDLRNGWLKGYRIGLVHGQLSRDKRERVMAAFNAGEMDALVATTVIEVGVDNPRATVMVIEHAERFGLAQLHQLRGRVGRGAARSYCILVVPARLGEEARARIRVILEHRSGFDIAEKDMQMRGPGELAGVRQSGLARLRVADIIRDARWIPVIRRDAEAYVQRFLAGGKDQVKEAIRFLRRWAKYYGLVQVG